MSRVFLGVVGMVAVAASQFQNAAARTGQPPCVQYTAPGPGDAAGRVPQTLQDYVTRMTAIVVGEVQSMVGSYTQSPYNQGMVWTFTVIEALKTTGPLQRVDASSANFGGFFVMHPGQHYILFLANENPGPLRTIPERSGVPRFHINGALCVDDTDNVHSFTKGRIGLHANSIDPIMGPLDGLSPDKALVEIRRALGSGK